MFENMVYYKEQRRALNSTLLLNTSEEPGMVLYGLI